MTASIQTSENRRVQLDLPSTATVSSPAAAAGLEMLAAAAAAAAAAEPSTAPQQQQKLPANFDPFFDSRLEFGHLIRSWLQLHGWSQDVPAYVARAAGRGHLAIHNSQVSDLQNGKLLQPKPKFFLALATFNELIADQSWIAASNCSPKLAQQIRNATPLAHPDGSLWRAADFFTAYIGDTF